jgi:uncharacterized membrane protein YraQ (UPF0718 family)
MQEKWKFLIILIVFLLFYFVPFKDLLSKGPLLEAFLMVQEYARQHVLLCLIPAFFIAGAISNFIKQESVIKYLGADAKKVLAYGVASVSGTILAVCSCTVLPLFAGIYTNGAGLGLACTFLYSGPAINVLAIILSARVLGMKIGIARAVGAIVLSIIIGLLMHFIFLKEEKNRQVKNASMFASNVEIKEKRNLLQTSLYFAVMVLILIFANWAKDETVAVWSFIYSIKWIVTGILLIVLAFMLVKWFEKEELRTWVSSTWIFSKQILPLLFIGVFAAGFFLGRPGNEGIIPSKWVSNVLGGNGIIANLFASVAGALMYFATLTEVPILQGLIGSGMGKRTSINLAFGRTCFKFAKHDSYN